MPTRHSVGLVGSGAVLAPYHALAFRNEGLYPNAIVLGQTEKSLLKHFSARSAPNDRSTDVDCTHAGFSDNLQDLKFLISLFSVYNKRIYSR